MSDAPTRRNGGEIRALTGLRGVAALLVASYHCTALGTQAPRLIAPLCRHGYLGVDLFFVLSGFLMARLYGTRCGNWAEYRRFMARRFARVYPAYFVAVVSTFLLVHERVLPALAPAARSWGRLAVDLAMLQCLGAGTSLLPVTWSLSTEWITYLAFPALSLLLLHGRARIACLLGVACVGVIVALCVAPDGWVRVWARTPRHAWLDVTNTTTLYPLLRCVADFGLGMLSCRAGQAARPQGFGTAAATSVIIIACTVTLWLQWADGVVVPVFAAMVSCIGMNDNPRGFAAVWLASRPVHWLGLISYSLYLTHLLVWQALSEPLAHWGVAPLWLIAPMLMVAWVCSVIVEQPGRRWLTSRVN